MYLTYEDVEALTAACNAWLIRLSCLIVDELFLDVCCEFDIVDHPFVVLRLLALPAAAFNLGDHETLIREGCVVVLRGEQALSELQLVQHEVDVLLGEMVEDLDDIIQLFLQLFLAQIPFPQCEVRVVTQQFRHPVVLGNQRCWLRLSSTRIPPLTSICTLRKLSIADLKLIWKFGSLSNVVTISPETSS